MKLMKHPILIILAITLMAIAAWSNYGQNKTSSKVSWEYKIAVNLSPSDMNSLGSQGWEMFAYSVDGNVNARMCFKRTK